MVYAYGAASFASSQRGDKLVAPTTALAKSLLAVIGSDPLAELLPVDEYCAYKTDSLF